MGSYDVSVSNIYYITILIYLFKYRLANHKEFAAGDVDTDFIERNYADLFPASIKGSQPR